MLGRIGALGATILIASLGCACVSKSSPVAPSTPAPTPTTAQSAPAVTLVVKVVTRGAEAPIRGASVFENDRLVGTTDSEGLVDATVKIGVEFHITVAATGYAGNGAWGTVNGEERWTFYLEPQP